MARRAGSADLPLQWAGAKVGRACPVNLTTRDFPSKSSEGRQPELFPAVSPAMLGNHDTHHGPNFHLEFLGRAFLGIWWHVSQQERGLVVVHRRMRRSCLSRRIRLPEGRSQSYEPAGVISAPGIMAPQAAQYPRPREYSPPEPSPPPSWWPCGSPKHWRTLRFAT